MMEEDNLAANFWEVLKKKRGLNVPNHLKHILFLQHCTNFVIMAEVDETFFPAIEKFVQSGAYRDSIPDNANFKDYYGKITSKDKPEEFKFSEGDKIILNIIIEFSKEYVSMMNKEKSCENELVPVNYITSSGKYSTFLSMLIRSAHLNADRKPEGFRYNKSLKYISSLIYILAGPILYKTLSHNLSMPSTTSVRRFIYDSGKVKEGCCRSLELKKFLEDRDLPLDVWLSEDATRLTNRIQYDPSTNQLVGFVLPLDNHSMPIPDSFTANSEEDIRHYFDNESTSSLLYVYIAQPLQENAPYFCVCLFGTDNKFNAMNVMQRWAFMVDCLKAEKIRVHGCSGDGDPRIMKAMRHCSQLGLKKHEKKLLNGNEIKINEFHAKIIPETVYTQDPVHKATKLRNRMLSASRILPMGNFGVSISHVKILMKKVSKDVHCLTETDVNPQDRMNFQSVMRLSNPLIPQLLRQHVPGSEATQEYLKIMLYAPSAFLSKTLSAAERIYCSWYSVFFLRIWRSYLDSQKCYSTSDNFITSNTYMCAELNAHAMLNLVFKCLESNSFKTFLPWLYGSQPCESFFRTYRSMSSVFLTVTSSTLLESLHKLNKIHLLNDIINHKFEADEIINFPIKTFLNASFETQSLKIDLPSLKNISKNNADLNIKVIEDVIARAKSDALVSSKKLGMNVSETAADVCMITCLEDVLSTNEDDYVDKDDEDEDETGDNETERDDPLEFEVDTDDGDVGLVKKGDGVELKTYPNVDMQNLGPNSPYIVVHDKQGREIIVRKSALCWMLSKTCKLSSDRLRRVRENELSKGQNANGETVEVAQKCNMINIGDWCLFKKQDSNECLVGCVISFAYFEERTSGRIQYSSEYAMVEGNSKKIGVNCQWYENNGKILNPVGQKFVQGYHDISFYRLTIREPNYDGKKISLLDNVYAEIKKYFKNSEL